MAMTAAALVMTNCSQEDEMFQTVSSPKTFTATIEGSSRSAVTDEGVFSWTYGDKFSVWTNENKFDVYANSESDVNTFAFVAEEDGATAGTPASYAIYPSGNHSISDGTVTVNLPATYTYGSTNALMLATIENNSTNLSFKHLGGLMRFNVQNVPAAATSFVFTMTENPITGSFTVTDGQIKASSSAVNNDNSVTITFETSNETRNMTFYVPLPVGTYGGYKVEIKGTDIALSHESTNVSNTIGRCTLLLMPTFTVENNVLKKGAGSTIAVTEQTASVSGNQSLTIDATNAGTNAVLTLNYTPQEGNATLSLSDGSEDTTPTTSAATVKVENSTNTAVETLNINTPTLTVELGSGEYGTVNALTATNTLVIGSGVTIETLVLNGGNVKLDADASIKKFTIPTGVETMIDLNNHTLKIEDETAAYGLINKGNATILNGTIEFVGDGSNGAAVCNMGQIELQSVNITSNTVCFRNYGSTVNTLSGLTAADATVTAVIDGGTFNSSFCNESSHDQHRYAVHAYMYSNMTMSGSTVKGSGGVSVDVAFATLNGVKAEATCQYGAHDLYVPCGNATFDSECEFTNAVAYSDNTYGNAVVNGKEYTESGVIAAYTTVSTADELTTAIANGGNIALSAAVDLNARLTVTTDATLDLNGKTLTIKASDAYGLVNKSKMSIMNGTIAFEGDATQNGAAVCNTAQIELRNVDITSNTVCFRNMGTTVTSLSSSTAAGATVTAVIDGGTFNSSYCPTETHDQHRYAVHAYMYSNMIMTGSTVSGSGGVSVDVAFATLNNVKAEAACQYGAHDLYVPCGNATVTDCTFANAAAYSDTTYGNAVVNGTEYTLADGETSTTKAITW